MQKQSARSKADREGDSMQIDTAHQESGALGLPEDSSARIFKFSTEELEKIKILMPQYYSFLRKDILDNIKAGNMPKGRGGKPQRIKFTVKKPIVAEHKQPEEQPQQEVIYPDFSNVQFSKNQEPQMFGEVIAGDFRPKVEPGPKPKQESKPLIKKKPLSRDQEIAQMTITKVFTPGVKLPNPSRYKQSLKREIQRRKKEKERQEREKLKQQATPSKKDNKKDKVSKSIITPSRNQKQIVENLYDQFQKNDKSTVIFQARTKPSMQFYWKMITAKKNKNYPLTAFQIDLRRMFKIYYNTSGNAAAKVKEVKKYQQQIFETIQTLKRRLGIAMSVQQQISKEKHELSQTVLTQSQTLNMRVRDRRRNNNNVVLNFSANKPKKRSNISRQVERQYSMLNREILGKNLCRMPKQQIEGLCLEFCLFSEQTTKESSATFDFNLMRMGAETLFQMENYVRNILARHSLPYLQLSDDQMSSQFVIQDD